MTGENERLAQIRMGDTITWPGGSGVVCGWSSVHAPYTVLVFGGYNERDRSIPLHRVLSRERPGAPVVRFNETISQGG